MAAVDVTAAVAEHAELIGTVVAVGVAVLGVHWVLRALKLFRETVGVPTRGDRMAAIREHAERLQASGQGQSTAYAEDASVSAYDAGYMGRDWDSSWGEEHRARWEKARADRVTDDEDDRWGHN